MKFIFKYFTLTVSFLFHKNTSLISQFLFAFNETPAKVKVLSWMVACILEHVANRWPSFSWTKLYNGPKWCFLLNTDYYTVSHFHVDWKNVIFDTSLFIGSEVTFWVNLMKSSRVNFWLTNGKRGCQNVFFLIGIKNRTYSVTHIVQ